MNSRLEYQFQVYDHHYGKRVFQGVAWVAKNINNTHNPVFYFNLLLNKRFVNTMKATDFY